MEPFVRRFIRASLVWFGVGVLLGLAMAVDPYRFLAVRPAHMHANLLGFVSMMIFGVAYHVIPRFAGAPLFSRRLAGLHFWVANAGLALLAGGWLARAFGWPGADPLVHAGAAGSAASAALFITNIWRTLDAAARPLPGVAAQPAPRVNLATRRGP